jgi:hypothetical protein
MLKLVGTFARPWRWPHHHHQVVHLCGACVSPSRRRRLGHRTAPRLANTWFRALFSRKWRNDSPMTTTVPGSAERGPTN